MTTTDYDALARSLLPLVSRVRTDVTAIKRADGRQAWTNEPLTRERLTRHLNGGPARGVSQINAGSSSTLVGLLDFDSHGGATSWSAMSAAARDVSSSIELLGGSPVSFRSSGGRGIHVYCLWEEAQDAYSVRQWLLAALRSCGYENGTKGVAARQVEVFPKQNEVPADGYGNQAVLPLAGLSVPLAWDDLVGELVPLPREAAIGMAWPMSDPVPRVERPVHVARSVAEMDLVGLDELRGLLDAIPNSGDKELEYDRWRDVVFAIHHETAGSETGLALAHAFSAKSGKYDAEFLDSRVWPFVRSEGRERVRGLGTLKRIAGGYGWHEPIDVDSFEDVSAQDNRPPVKMTEWAEAMVTGLPEVEGGGEQREAARVEVPPMPPAPPTPPRMLARVKRRGIPEAHHLTTDQANAQRLKNAFGSLVFVAAGKWHVWDGRRWHADESDVYRYGCRLSELIGEEAKVWAAKSVPLLASQDPAEVAEGKKLAGVAEALRKWALKSEMKGCIEAAIGLARKMLTLDIELLDRDPDLLNCANGTVDLRTGVLRPHDPADYITKLVPVAYRADATCVEWLRALEQISGGLPGWVDYLQRWSGYCLTGWTTEQVFVVLWGGGGNGKGVVVGMLTATAGEYAGTAAPGLLVASKGSERHPTEIASLMGRRMVTAHETGEGVVLREDFVKQATGGDRLTARFMREDFFEFDPTHKIQLLTNHKPQIRGQDMGIWRRVTLLPFVVSFGTAAQVAAGTHSVVRDDKLLLRLQAELEGVLAWRVRGAVEWAQAGLQPPDVVRAASEGYKREQDRVGQFVAECCEVGLEWSEPLTEGMGGLYPAYVSWCKDGGVFPLSKVRFMDEVLRVVPVGRVEDRQVPVVGGGRRRVKIIQGLRLLQE